MSHLKKEATPCAANNPNQSPTPTAAPSQDPSPVTARGASTGTTAPGGQMAQAPTCECMTCTCDGCHEECFGHCHGCGKPIRNCNSYQTEGEKNFSHPADAGGNKLYFNEDASLVYRFSGTGRFQFWLFSGHQEWKPSDFLNQTYARENRENLKPPSQWMADSAAAHGWKEITKEEFDEMCCMNAPAAAAAATTEVPAAASLETSTTLESAEGASNACPVAEPERPDFDYSGLDARTVDTLHMAESQYTQGKKMAETGLRWMVNAVSMAHDALCGTASVVQQLDNSKHGNRGDDSFRAWCASISLSKSSAYNLLRVADRFGSIQLDGKSILDVQPATLLYEAAKPSAPAELVQGVKDGDITTHKQYQELLAQIKAKDDEIAASKAQRDAALKERDDANAAKARAEEIAVDAKNKAQEAYAREERAREAAHQYHVQSEEATAARNALLDQQAEYIQAASEKDARIRELEARPVEVVGATPEDIARWRAEGAEQARKESRQELRRISAEAAKERKRADEAERDRDAYADTMEQYASQLGELRGRQEMTDEQLHAIYTAEKAGETCTMVICQALGEIYDLPRDLKAQAMNHLQNLHICLGKAISLGYWPTDEDLEDDLDEPDEWPEDEE